MSVAPMMDWTDRHCRYLHRQISRTAWLYTEMVTSAALVRGRALHLLDHDPAEHPVALQLGGSDPAELAEAAALGQEAGYAEINLNVGCPSDRVQSGCFGAVLMERPALVAQCVAAMRAAVAVPVTVKCRIGVDDQVPEAVLPDFLARVTDAGAVGVTIHARKAWLQGLSPRENREVPPLDYALVLKMREKFSDIQLSINGGITDLDQVQGFLDQGLDGVMVGRAAYHTPWDILGDADRRLWGVPGPADSPQEVVHRMLPYIQAHLDAGGRLHQVTRHMLGLFAGRPGARLWRRFLSEQAHHPDAGTRIVEEALARLPLEPATRAV